jgi:BirA family transcriptional regulator, biotin operon repressor / biotin---[acetyl-CoA-carboxylase] ligase
MNLNETTLRQILAGKFIGHRIHYYESVGSTNDEAFRLGVEGAPEGTVVLAESQSKGKGRLQRIWHSPAGANIYTSVILRPDFEPVRAPQLSITAGVAVAELLNIYYPGQVQLKWPNDVLLSGKKVCGILAQMKIAQSVIDFVVLGIGINVNIGYNQFPSDLRNIATSLAIETGSECSRLELTIGLYENLAKWYKQLLQNGFNTIKEKWLSLAPMIGANVQVLFREQPQSGKAIGLDDDGSLILLTAGNKEIKVSAGDATIIKGVLPKNHFRLNG